MLAMILAAGFGTRLKPLTQNMPKALIPLCGVPLLQIVLDRLVRFGFDKIAINAHHHAAQIEAFLAAYPAQGLDIKLSMEREILETGGGIKAMLPLLRANEPILVQNVDVLTGLDLSQIMAVHRSSGALATLAVQDRATQRPLLFDANKALAGRQNRISKMTEIVRRGAGALNPLAFNGIQVIQPELFANYPGTAFSSIDVYLAAAAKGEIISAFKMENCYWRDLGKPSDLQQAQLDIEQGHVRL